nr:5-methyltetrahydropteroyltriglutamate--homocysteine S-methyltransferase [Actinomycetota bacterium]
NLGLIRSAPAGKEIVAGVLDGRNTKLEDEAELCRLLEDLVGSVGADRLWAGPSCGLEYLPREKAQAKLRHLVSAAKKVGA